VSLLLGERLRQIRKKHGYTQQNVADVIGVDRTTYTVYEIGPSTPSVSTLYKLSRLYNVSVDYLMGVENEKHYHETVQTLNSTPLYQEEVPKLDKQEKLMLMFFRILDNQGKKHMLEYMKEYSSERYRDIFEMLGPDGEKDNNGSAD